MATMTTMAIAPTTTRAPSEKLGVSGCAIHKNSSTQELHAASESRFGLKELPRLLSRSWRYFKPGAYSVHCLAICSYSDAVSWVNVIYKSLSNGSWTTFPLFATSLDSARVSRACTNSRWSGCPFLKKPIDNRLNGLTHAA